MAAANENEGTVEGGGATTTDAGGFGIELNVADGAPPPPNIGAAAVADGSPPNAGATDVPNAGEPPNVGRGPPVFKPVFAGADPKLRGLGADAAAVGAGAKLNRDAGTGAGVGAAGADAAPRLGSVLGTGCAGVSRP